MDAAAPAWYPNRMTERGTAGDWPRISLVMPNLNYGEFLEEAIQSVLRQEYPALEFIIVDGGSTDSSHDIIDRYRPHLADALIGPDEGQADAINKGLARATGEIFQWINSDDLLEPGALATVARSIGGFDSVAGICTDFDGTGWERAVVSKRLSSRTMIRHPTWVVFHQPALWLRTEAVRACGGIDPAFHFMFDYDLTVRYLDRFPRVRYVARSLVRFRLHGRSKTVVSKPEFLRERREIIRKLAGCGSPRLRRRAALMTRRIDWWDRLEEILNLPASRITRCRLLLTESLSRPGTRVGRGVVKALWRVLVGG